jgi:UDP-glucose 4-epimerase
MKKILITGNAGMIGTVLSRYFESGGYQVVGVDNLSGGFREHVSERVRFYPADICDSALINRIFDLERPNYIIHCAAYAAEILSPFVRNFNYTNNLVGSVNIINAAINFSVEKFINFSSIATYGDIPAPFVEGQMRSPKDCYGIAKLAVEADLAEAGEHFGLNYSTLLPHNVISLYQNYFDRYRNVIAIWIRQCLYGENISIFGDGSQVRSFSDASFLCAPVEKLFTMEDRDHYNIGSDQPITILDAAALLLKVAAKHGFKGSKIVHLEPRREVKTVYSSHEKARRILGFEDKTDLEKTMHEMFEYASKLEKREVLTMPYEITKNLYGFWR